MADLAGRGFEVHAVSVRGHGASEPAGRFATVLSYAEDLFAALAAVGERPILVGHSSGGYVTQLLITGAVGRRPRLAGAVLLCSSPVNIGAYFVSRGLRGEATVDIRALLQREPEAVRHAFFRPDISAEELERHRLRMVDEPPLLTLSSMLLRPHPERCRTPTLVIAAECDTVFDVAAQRETAEAYDAELVVVPGATHNLMLDPAWPVAGDAIERFAASLA